MSQTLILELPMISEGIAVAIITGTFAAFTSWLANRKKFSRLEARQDEIHHEVKPNSGKSMKDRSELTIRMLDDIKNKMDVQTAEIRGEIKVVNARLDAHSSAIDRASADTQNLSQALVQLGDRIHAVATHPKED